MEFQLGRYPLEVFGHAYHATDAAAVAHRAAQHCPFLNRTCTKPRKSEPDIKVGICTVGYQGRFLQRCTPIIICPCRFLEDGVFRSIRDQFFPNWAHVRWVSEVNMGVGGNVDFVAVKTDEGGTAAEDFFCVEFQASGTTGSPYPYVKDLLNTGRYDCKHTFGINWANEFMKTMMQQVYKKGQVVASWGRKIVFVVQDVALEYLEHAVDTADLRQAPEDTIYFMTVQMVWDETAEAYHLEPARWVSTDLNGINKILAGANPDQYLTEEDFLGKAIKKGNEDGVLHV